MTIRSDALYTHLIEDLSEALDCSDRDLLSISESSFSVLTYRQAAVKQLLNSFYKKLVESKGATADQKAIDKLLAINDRCENWSRDIRGSLFIDELRGHFKVEMHKFFEPRNRQPLVSGLEEILHFARTGPGASIGASGNDFYTKLFSSPISCTSRVLEVAYTRYISNSHTWNYAENFRRATGLGFDIVSGNRVSLVPKNVDISRTICIEPNLNMFFQLGLGRIIERRLGSNFGIDLSIQPVINRELARYGSEFDNLCTIDLESASDSISMKMAEEFIPRDFMLWLKLLRSPESILPDGRRVKLNMVSTMGNGFTFPLQTAIFACVVRACQSYLRSIRKYSTESMSRAGSYRVKPDKSGFSWTVFGDDIIVPTTLVGPVVHLLNDLGFLVNMHKSFLEGPFRESCGSDYFRGRDVRGVYIKSLRTLQDRFVAINLLNRWSGTTGIYVPRTIRYLLARVRYQPVPVWENDDAGIKVPYDLVKRKRLHRDFQSIMYTRSVSKPKRITISDGTISVPRGVRKRIYNPEGLLLAFLRGDVQNGRITIRHGENTYRPRMGIAPNWDRSPTVSVFATEVERQRWETAVRLNFEAEPGH